MSCRACLRSLLLNANVSKTLRVLERSDRRYRSHSGEKREKEIKEAQGVLWLRHDASTLLSVHGTWGLTSDHHGFQ